MQRSTTELSTRRRTKTQGDGMGPVRGGSTEGVPDGSVSFTCNICGWLSEVETALLRRETSSCPRCGSTGRWRAVVYALSVALFGEALSIPQFPTRPDLTGVGLSDDSRYADRLPAKLAYRNTFYDREPWLDVTNPPKELYGTLDFLISSDVFEHVAPPVQVAFENSCRLLKPGGAFILTVPYMAAGETIEHFPTLSEYEVVDFNGTPILINKTAAGDWEIFDDIRFHGGLGATLEMRCFSRPSLLRHLEAAGFDEIVEFNEPYPDFGIGWTETEGFPILARRRSE